MGFWKCFAYLVLLSIAAFFVGRLLPARWFLADRFPYRCHKFERDGKLYSKLRVHLWQNKLPDMSRILPKCIPAKNLKGNYREHLPRMLQETCIAEMIHKAECVAGLLCLHIWPGVGGVVITMLYMVVFNLPFILIQRYNRPRLLKLMQKMQRTEQKSKENTMPCVY